MLTFESYFSNVNVISILFQLNITLLKQNKNKILNICFLKYFITLIQL